MSGSAESSVLSPIVTTQIVFDLMGMFAAVSAPSYTCPPAIFQKRESKDQ